MIINYKNTYDVYYIKQTILITIGIRDAIENVQKRKDRKIRKTMECVIVLRLFDYC